MAARARRARQLLGKETFLCYQFTQRCRLLYSPLHMYSPPNCTLNIPLLPVYTTLSTAVLSTSYIHSTSHVFFCCTDCTRRVEDNRIYCSTRNLVPVCTLNIPLLPMYTTLSTAVLSTSYVLSTYYVFFCCTACTRRVEDNRMYCCTRNLVCMYFTVLFVVRNGSQVLEYTVVHSVQAADTSLLFECTMLHSKP